ncbi:AAA family ATPase [Fictibacillus sp. 5RED26]|uniref:AAA family ATPase n=1 Tax=Fictibacillus sp. 5RED26 TaxID=2745876 RepID=UPI0018CCD903|nr:AAA family ATPase [Fictibacillus sp. 5RED26]MBH0158685.1 AAA family ATPase [Fictibacillus sp. 5RED26]
MFLNKLTVDKGTNLNLEKYPFSIPTIKHLSEYEFKSNITFFVGENGTGKSTLLEALAYKIGFNTSGGSKNNSYINNQDNTLGETLKLSWLPKVSNGFFLRAETFFQFAEHIDSLAEIDRKAYIPYGGKSLLEQSHGESFFSLFNNRFSHREKSIYLLDEPEAALSPSRQLALLRTLKQHDVRKKSQFIIATHSPILLGYPDATIVSFDNEELKEITYEETEHYLITKYFINNKEKFLSEIFEDL